MQRRSVLSERSQKIVALLPEHKAPADLEARIRGFVRANGFAVTYQAAQRVAERAQAGKKIANPWLQLVGIVNDEQARGHQLQPLFHWIENALRTRLDLVLSAAYGDDQWHLEPDNYVLPEVIQRDWGTGRHFNYVSWATDPSVFGGRKPSLQAYPTAEAFLSDCTFGDLVTMARFCYAQKDPDFDLALEEVECKYSGCQPYGATTCCTSPHRHSTARLLSMDAGCRNRTQAIPSRSLLFASRFFGMAKTVKGARNRIDHSLILAPNHWVETWRDARHLAMSLGFDLSKATLRLGRKQWLRTHVNLVALGFPDGINALQAAEK